MPESSDAGVLQADRNFPLKSNCAARSTAALKASTIASLLLGSMSTAFPQKLAARGMSEHKTLVSKNIASAIRKLYPSARVGLNGNAHVLHQSVAVVSDGAP